MRKRKNLVFSSISDEDLKLLISQDREKNPSEFIPSILVDMKDTNLFLHNTSGRGIEPMKKWL